MNRDLFKSSPAAPPDTTNAAGGLAYVMTAEESLAQLVCTGFFADTFYVEAKEQLNQVLDFASKCDDQFVAQCARYARRAGFMKDSPAVLLAYLFGKKSAALTHQLFHEVIDNAKMLSNFVAAVRSAKFGRRSLGTRGKKLVSSVLNSWGLDYLWRQSIAKDPSLADVIRLARPKAPDAARNAMFRFLIGKEPTAELPQLVRDTLAFREGMTKDPAGCALPVPDVPFNMIDSVKLRADQWKELFNRGGFQFTRMNLNTAQRQGVLDDPDVVRVIAERLADAEGVRKARQFPYQLYMSYKAATIDRGDAKPLPDSIRDALHAAMENSLMNVPEFPAKTFVAVDCSGSMFSPATGRCGPMTSAVSYAEVAALFAAAIAKKTPGCRVMTFTDTAVFVDIERRDTVASIALKLAKAGGGTNCSAPLAKLNEINADVGLFILISDLESWLDSGYSRTKLTGTVEEWAKLKHRCPDARQIRINISPNATDQLPKRRDTLRVGGFSDAVFSSIAAWTENRDWVKMIRDFAVSAG